MDSILSSWNRFTLSDKETSHVHLTRRGDNPEFVLAAKFLTKRALNVEAIGRTFKSLWKSRKEFKIRDVGNHVVLFVFQTDTDAERVLMNEPWSFVKYLVLFKRLENNSSTQKINFSHTLFWIQLHGLPMNKQNIDIAEEVGKTGHSSFDSI
nr:hypothetical protein CFP56_07049 [Quercus suber]